MKTDTADLSRENRRVTAADRQVKGDNGAETAAPVPVAVIKRETCMDNKRHKNTPPAFVVFLLILVMLAGCSTKKLSGNEFFGVWDYPEADVRLKISEDNTWEMLDDTGNPIAGGDCVVDGDRAELYYTFGSPWENEDGPVMYNVLHYEKKGKLSDAVGEPLFLTDEN